MHHRTWWRDRSLASVWTEAESQHQAEPGEGHSSGWVGPPTAKRLAPKEAILMRGMWRLFSLVERSSRPGLYGWISSAGYPGPDPLWARYVMVRILQVMHSLTLSQWRSWDTGVMWSDLHDLVTTHAAAFWTGWRRAAVLSGRPYRRALQWSSLLIMNAWARVSAVRWDMKLPTSVICLSWKCADLQMCRTWACRLKCLSRSSPKLVAASEREMDSSPTLMWVMSLLEVSHFDWISRISVFSPFVFS